MPPSQPIQSNVASADLTARFGVSKTVAASPTDNAETLIATLTLSQFANLSVVAGVKVEAFAAFTVGTNGTAVQLRIRQTNISGSVVADTGAVTAGIAATKLAGQPVAGFDSGAGVGVYVLTMQVTGGSAASTVSALVLAATII